MPARVVIIGPGLGPICLDLVTVVVVQERDIHRLLHTNASFLALRRAGKRRLLRENVCDLALGTIVILLNDALVFVERFKGLFAQVFVILAFTKAF